MCASAQTLPGGRTHHPDVKRFSDIRRKRSTALVMLLLWLFAVSSGIVNACVLDPHGTDAPVAGFQPSAHATAAMPGHAETGADHEGHQDSSKAPCTKVCDDGSQALIKQQPSFDVTDRGPALTDSIHWIAAASIVAADCPLGDPPKATSEPPVRLRYSRLALVPGVAPPSPQF